MEELYTKLKEEAILRIGAGDYTGAITFLQTARFIQKAYLNKK